MHKRAYGWPLWRIASKNTAQEALAVRIAHFHERENGGFSDLLISIGGTRPFLLFFRILGVYFLTSDSRTIGYKRATSSSSSSFQLAFQLRLAHWLTATGTAGYPVLAHAKRGSFVFVVYDRQHLSLQLAFFSQRACHSLVVGFGGIPGTRTVGGRKYCLVAYSRG